jgi:hypothetical protein
MVRAVTTRMLATEAPATTAAEVLLSGSEVSESSSPATRDVTAEEARAGVDETEIDWGTIAKVDDAPIDLIELAFFCNDLVEIND